MMLRKVAGSARVGVNVMFEFLGSVIGGFLGLAGPFLYAQIYVAHGGDPTAVGALWIVTFISVPAGVVIGVVLGFVTRCFARHRKRS